MAHPPLICGRCDTPILPGEVYDDKVGPDNHYQVHQDVDACFSKVKAERDVFKARFDAALVETFGPINPETGKHEKVDHLAEAKEKIPGFFRLSKKKK